MDPTLAALGVLAIVILIAISGYFSSSELAVFSIPSHRIDALAATGGRAETALATLRADPHRFLVTVLVSNNVANIAAASVATALLVQVLPPGQAATGATIATSFFVIVFGEIAPKSYAVSHSESWALRVARPVSVIQRLVWPVLWIFEVAARAVSRVTGGDPGFEAYLSREEIVTLVLSGEETGVIDTDEGAMIRGVLDLERTRTTAVMVPRTDMISLPKTADVETVIDTAADHRVTRIPVYGENRDDVIGIVDVRDALRARESGASLTDIIEQPHFVPETKPVDELLSDMQLEGRRMVIAVDEFGAVTGLATIEDVVEEVVGEIVGRDEADPLTIVDDSTAIARGWAGIGYVNEMLNLDLPVDDDVATIAGLITSHTGRLADEGDSVEFGAVTLTVLDATRTRIRRVRIDREETVPDS